MIDEITARIMRARSVRRALESLVGITPPALLIAPSTRGAIALAQALCAVRTCCVTAGPVLYEDRWGLRAHLSTPAEIARAFAGHAALSRMVISFPDQQLSTGAASLPVPFLDARYAFSMLEALLVARHRPPVYALSTSSALGDFKLDEICCDDLFDAQGRLLSFPALMQRLLSHLERELAHPPRDWLAGECLAMKSEAVRLFCAREELKEVECLLRMHLQTRYCDTQRTGAALAAVVERQRLFSASVSP